jgi:DNA ligase-1
MLPELIKYNGCNPSGFYMSEKLNGVRALWNGREFISKNGKAFAVPGELLQAIPAQLKFDGELYAGGNLEKIAGLCRRKVPAPVAEWQGVTFQAFDISLFDVDFQGRYSMLTSRFLLSNSFFNVVPQIVCNGREHLKNEFDRITAKGGEGIVLKSPLHKFRPGQSELAQKIKYIDDFEVNGCTFDETGKFLVVRDYE